MPERCRKAAWGRERAVAVVGQVVAIVAWAVAAVTILVMVVDRRECVRAEQWTCIAGCCHPILHTRARSQIEDDARRYEMGVASTQRTGITRIPVVVHVV
jgi:hypothetical protein